jgi:ABC-type polysaccharide/polyol phosphate export permease
MLVRGTQMGLNSIQSRKSILSHIYIPNEIPAISASLTSLIMLSFEMIVFGIFLVVFRFVPPTTIAILPVILGLEFVLVVGFSLPLSLLNVKFRDTQFIWGVILQASFFATPVFYQIDILPKKVQSIIIYNPMVQILNMAHNAVLYGSLPSPNDIAIAVGTTFLIFGIGYGIFRKMSRRIIEEL